MNKKTNLGLKVSTKEISDAVVKKSKQQVLPHLLLAIAMPYLLGAKKQVERYMAAAKILPKNGILGTQICLHEFSCLFEDLATVARYIELAGKKHKLHKLWYDIRDHIRHDFREEFDREASRKARRAETLGIGPGLQTDIRFDREFVKVGTTIVSIKQVRKYLAWAEETIDTVLVDAKKKGMIKYR